MQNPVLSDAGSITLHRHNEPVRFPALPADASLCELSSPTQQTFLPDYAQTLLPVHAVIP